LVLLGVLPGNRTQPFVRLTGGCRHQSGGEYRGGSGGRNRTFARLIQSQSGSPERARMTDPADGFEPSSTASKTVLPPRPTGTFRSSARRGDRTHLEQIKNLLPHQSAWRAFITSTIRFSKWPLPVGNAVFVGRPRIELGELRGAPGLQPGPPP
jgi:hypothetical protein